MAAEEGNIAQLNLVIEFAPERINETNKTGTPLHFAAGYGHEAAVSLLLSAKADVDATNSRYSYGYRRYGGGSTPLHYAARNVQEAAVSLLLSAKADVNKTDSNGTTALGFAEGDRVKQLLRDAGGH